MAKTAVVILNWNGEVHLRRFLPSVVANTPAVVDIIVADNGSTDSSIAILEQEFPTVRIIKLDNNYGFAAGYNKALQQVDADYCVLLNSDVETPAGWIEPLIARLSGNPSIAAVAPKLLSVENRKEFEYAGASGGFIDWFGYPFCRGRILQSLECDEGQYDDSREVFWVSGAAFCCRMDVFRMLGGFADDFFAHMEEIDLCWRMQLAGYSVVIEPASKVYHLGGGTLATSSPRKIFFNHRNNLMMLFRCAPTFQRYAVAPLRLVTDTLAAISYLAQGQPRWAWAVARAYWDFLKWHSRLASQRKAIRSAVVKESSAIYKGSIVVRYMLGKRKFNNII